MGKKNLPQISVLPVVGWCPEPNSDWLHFILLLLDQVDHFKENTHHQITYQTSVPFVIHVSVAKDVLCLVPNLNNFFFFANSNGNLTGLWTQGFLLPALFRHVLRLKKRCSVVLSKFTWTFTVAIQHHKPITLGPCLN